MLLAVVYCPLQSANCLLRSAPLNLRTAEPPRATVDVNGGMAMY
jgi:hypothetical protein